MGPIPAGSANVLPACFRAAGLHRGRVSIIPGKYHGSFGQRTYLYRPARRGVHPGGLVSLAEPEPLKTARSPWVGSESSSASGRRRNAMA